MNLKKHYLLIFIFAILAYSINLDAASIVLRSGTALKGKLIDRNDEEITIQDPATKQLRVIKAIFIKDLVLDPGEEKIGVKKKPAEPAKKGGTGAGGATASPDLLAALEPALGLMPGVAIPFGKINKGVNIGFGFTLFSDLSIPMKLDVLKIRPGLSIGFLYHTTKGGSPFSLEKRSPYVMMIPVIAYIKLQFIAPHGFRPYIKIGGGITPVLAQGMTSMDPTFAPGVGLGYVNGKIPYLEFYIDMGVLMAFEKVRGDFITASAGIAYRFGAPPPATGLK